VLSNVELKENRTIIPLKWGDIENIILSLSEKVKTDGIPDLIFGIQRGGLIPSVILSHYLEVRELIPFNISITSDDYVYSKKMSPKLGDNVSLEVITNKDILVVDDITGSGETLKVVMDIIQKYSPARIRVLTCIVNRDNWDVYNSYEPSELLSYIGREVKGWITFPWERGV
jgi:uncharacterized protein